MDPAILELARNSLIEKAKEQLRSRECNVTFTKVDGTERKMRCTTKSDLIPNEKHPTGKHTYNDELTARVFDLDLQEWRSFKWDNVIEFNGWKR